MPIYHDCAQYGEEYDRLKLGIPTSSSFAKIITPTEHKKSSQWNSYKFQLIAERLLGNRIHTYTSPAMERGIIVEAEAVDWYELDHDVDTRRIGFVTDDNRTMGCSPDRLVGDDGLLEIKCPDNPAQQVEYHLRSNSIKRYWSQLQGQLLIAEREWVDIVAWYPALPKKVLRVERDEPFITLLSSLLDQFISEVEEGADKMMTAGYVHVPEAKATLQDMLKAALASP